MHLRPLKRFGQNFLQDQHIIARIASICPLAGRAVLEIGPGRGALTRALLARGATVVAFEIDRGLSQRLSNEFAQNQQCTIINQDFLKACLTNYQGFSIIANVPYNITSAILFKILAHQGQLNDVILMVQREVAQRLSARCGSRDYGKLSVTMSLFYKITRCFDVPPQAFYPVPQVTSSVVHLQPQKAPVAAQDITALLNFIKNCFAMKRKTLQNNLRARGLTMAAFSRFCAQENLAPDIRPQHLSPEQYIRLFQIYRISL